MVRRVAKHNFQFRGTWLPARAWDLLKQNEINVNEMILISTIDALSTDDDPCWASNEELAAFIGMSPNSTGNMISRLVKQGYLDRVLHKTQTGTKRHLLVVWNFRTPLVSGVRTPLANGVLYNPSDYIYYNTGDDDNIVGGQDMPFMKEFEKEAIEDIHHQRAARLIVGLRKSMRLTGPANTSKWSVHFKRLHKDLQGDDARIDKVLVWFLNNIKSKYTPRVWSASSFRSKFVPIEDAMARATGDEPGIDIEITELAIRIANRLRMKGWPKGSAEDLPRVVQISLTNYDEFIARLRKFHEELHGLDIPKYERDRLARIVSYLTNGGLPGASHYVEQWMSTVNESIATWDGWSGDLTKQAFRTDSKMFKRFGRELMSNYCNETKPWDRIMELMYADSEA